MPLHALPQALGPIFANTPTWVWGLLAGLVALGLSQARERTVGLPRLALMPAAMTAFSIWGMASAFGASPQAPQIAAVWLAAAALLFTLLSAGQPAGRYDPASRRFRLPGSLLPLGLILGLFCVKYAVGVTLAMRPHMAGDPGFALAVAALYGGFSGSFLGRAVRILKLAFRPLPAHAGA